ncbi:hypothetical protein [Lampropedia aestuarii]|uniref:hypothetical protein n=1 Tax=Lampropedia aestuarii TaxID=2562762 RepID=UPI0024687337|nr:hypothetical protein [Lampropedia aestuarii]MDH5857805.1 hypothetical protein [Lampropedia aestuarii]
MTNRLSSGLRHSMVSNYGLGSMLNFGHIRIYSGTQPDSADLPPTGVLLAVVSAGGIDPVPGTQTGGLEVDVGSEYGQLVNVGNWVLKGKANGVPGWWRFVWSAPDNDSESQYYPRLDGAVGESLILGVDAITIGMELPVNRFNLVLL